MSSSIFKKTFLFLILAELLSIFGYLLPNFNKSAFFAIVLLTLILSFIKLEYGIFIILAELFIGSKGYLFFFDFNGSIISIRIALWLVVMSVWLSKIIINLIKTKKIEIEFLKSSHLKYFSILFLFIIWGIINGFLNNNEFSNIFFDFNGWLYFALIFPVYEIIKNKENINKIFYIFTACIAWLSLKTLFLLFVFSHNMTSMITELYRWVRITGVGEITQMQGGFYRIFFQSHIFVLIGFFIFLLLITRPWDKKNYNYLLLITIFLSTTIISFSRSNWVGLVVGLILYFIFVLWQYGFKDLLKKAGILFCVSIASVMLILAIVKFPYPSPTGGFSTTELLTDRASQITGEAGVSSRWALLPELWSEIKKAPILGQGFGATVTYKSSDPRVLEKSPDGEYTTYAFEWGWMDVWLKLGFFGLLSYLALIFFVILNGLKQRRHEIIGLVIGLIVISVVSFFSPYMNHPLGIGYLILVSSILSRKHGFRF
ncbi:MAG: O-antigen ligase family protein [Candidatus Falkowbacteria bacterium]